MGSLSDWHTDEEQIGIWQRALDACSTLKDFNLYIVPPMRSRGDVFLKMAATEARRRRYKANKATGLYEEGE